VRDRRRHERQLRQIAQRLTRHRLRVALPLQRQTEQAHLELAVAVRVLVNDRKSERAEQRKARLPRERDPLHRQELRRREPHRAATGLQPHLAPLANPDLARPPDTGKGALGKARHDRRQASPQTLLLLPRDHLTLPSPLTPTLTHP
jgi:hypothetical protein